MMSRLREPESPCPVNSRASRAILDNNGGITALDYWQADLDAFEDTATVEFTTEIRAPLLTKTKPRRIKNKPAFKIHEDSKEATTLTPGGLSRLGSDSGTTAVAAILSQPAQRFQRAMNTSTTASLPNASRFRTVLNSKLGEANALPSKRKCPLTPGEENANEELKKDVPKSDMRRGTIYIPLSDTAMPTVFMGLFSPINSQSSNIGRPSVPKNTQANDSEAQITTKRSTQTSVAAPPRRAPLKHKTKYAQELAVTSDIVGKGGGKENIPPGTVFAECKNSCIGGALAFKGPSKKAKERLDSAMSYRTQLKRPRSTVQLAGRVASRKPSEISPSEGRKSATPLVSSFGTANVGTPKMGVSMKVNPTAVPKNAIIPLPSAASLMEVATVKRSSPDLAHSSVNRKYPLLTEDIWNPLMYEDCWLSHQEIAITQLVNGLFNTACSKVAENDPETLRHGLLEIYQGDPFAFIYKRLQASILSGALGIPKDMLARKSRLKGDLGLKRSFLNLWIETYDHSALRAAAETVIGRTISISSTSQNGNTTPCHPQGRALKRALEAFLETFLLRNEDMELGPAKRKTGETNGCCAEYRRTVLRSILLVILLDKGRTCTNSLLPRCLFVTPSPYKSSAAVLQALGDLLLPSVGDITRRLNHLGCRISYEQHPLQEHEYRINNLAVELRDGVRLTRLVELLFYTSSFTVSQHNEKRQTTITLPNGKVLSVLGKDSWPLSQHLKFPCVGRVTKIFNVQIALSALLEANGVGTIVQSVRAEDIVDGHREKTIALLWALVGKSGLAGLIDWDDVRNEIVRLKLKVGNMPREQTDNDEGNSENEGDFDGEHERRVSLLTQWASILAQLKGMRLDNLTTSFADGKIFECIIEEYEGFIFKGRFDNSTVPHKYEGGTTGGCQTPKVSLESRLRALGCSSQFASLVHSSDSVSPHIFDKDFTLAALAFLCSRLLSASRRARAALVVQSAWRRTLAHRALHHRLIAKKIAIQCATVVHTRNRILWAKQVIVDWWRREKAKKERRVARSLIGPPKANCTEQRSRRLL